MRVTGGGPCPSSGAPDDESVIAEIRIATPATSATAVRMLRRLECRCSATDKASVRATVTGVPDTRSARRQASWCSRRSSTKNRTSHGQADPRWRGRSRRANREPPGSPGRRGGRAPGLWPGLALDPSRGRSCSSRLRTMPSGRARESRVTTYGIAARCVPGRTFRSGWTVEQQECKARRHQV